MLPSSVVKMWSLNDHILTTDEGSVAERLDCNPKKGYILTFFIFHDISNLLYFSWRFELSGVNRMFFFIFFKVILETGDGAAFKSLSN